MGIGQAKPSVVNLKLVDRSLVHLEKRIDDVLIQVDKFVFHADFIILDFEAYENVPILLGRPFLATWRTLIDVYKGNLIMRMNDQQIKFNIPKAMAFTENLLHLNASVKILILICHIDLV